MRSPYVRTCLYHPPKSSWSFLIVTPKLVMLLGSSLVTASESFPGLLDGFWGFATGTTPDTPGAEAPWAAGPEPRTEKEISLIETLTDERYFCRSDAERWVPPTAREGAVDEANELDSTSRTEAAFASVTASGDTTAANTSQLCLLSLFDNRLRDRGLARRFPLCHNFADIVILCAAHVLEPERLCQCTRFADVPVLLCGYEDQLAVPTLGLERIGLDGNAAAAAVEAAGHDRQRRETVCERLQKVRHDGRGIDKSREKKEILVR